jgi:ABC-type bacteriocin/lantibiotic exporter with double-glycine peptidase domain
LFRLSKRHGHFVFSVIQSFLTSAVATAIAHSTDATAVFLGHWVRSWLLSWVTVLPIVLLAAPVIRRIVDYVSRDRTTG